jgi:hypothetical protein
VSSDAHSAMLQGKFVAFSVLCSKCKFFNKNVFLCIPRQLTISNGAKTQLKLSFSHLSYVKNFQSRNWVLFYSMERVNKTNWMFWRPQKYHNGILLYMLIINKLNLNSMITMYIGRLQNTIIRTCHNTTVQQKQGHVYLHLTWNCYIIQTISTAYKDMV